MNYEIKVERFIRIPPGLDCREQRFICKKTMNEDKYWYCTTCGKTATSLNPDKNEAAPEHISYRGIDLGKCFGVMEMVRKDEWEQAQTPRMASR